MPLRNFHAINFFKLSSLSVKHHNSHKNIKNREDLFKEIVGLGWRLIGTLVVN